jgi:hypothetical protein
MVGLQPAHGRRKIAKLSLLIEDKIPPLGQKVDRLRWSVFSQLTDDERSQNSLCC